eukprot:g8101.t1
MATVAEGQKPTTPDTCFKGIRPHSQSDRRNTFNAIKSSDFLYTWPVRTLRWVTWPKQNEKPGFECLEQLARSGL